MKITPERKDYLLEKHNKYCFEGGVTFTKKERKELDQIFQEFTKKLATQRLERMFGC